MFLKPWLELQGIEAWINKNKVFENFDLNLYFDQSTAIIGPNGAGKSTLIKLIEKTGSENITELVQEYPNLDKL